jgi:hypothetical protein
MRRAFALLALLSAGCADPVVLGSECLTASGVCEQSKPLPDGDGVDAGGAPSEADGGEDPPPSSLDGGGDEQPPMEPRDSGGPPRDAAMIPVIRDAARPPPVPPDAGPATYPQFLNPSFELVDGGSEGEVSEFPNAQLPSESPIAPWYNNCRTGTTVTSMATYGLPGRMTTVTPSDGDTFVTDTFPIVVLNTNGITQELTEPLVAGKRYAFAVDVYAQFDLLMLRELVLDVMYPDPLVNCLGRPLAVTTPIPPGSWQTRCIDFIAPESLARPIRSLMLMANAPGDFVNITAALHFDNIRPATPALCGNGFAP